MNISLLKNFRDLFNPLQLPSSILAVNKLTLVDCVSTLQNNFAQELNIYLSEHPHTKHVDIYLNDTHGTFRGKRVAIENLYSPALGIYFPQSVYSMDSKGKVMNPLSDDIIADEPDRLCLPVPGTLRPSAHSPDTDAQLLLTMKNPNGSPYLLEPRVILENVLRKFHVSGLFPIIAPEIEFYLVDKQPSEIRSLGCFNIDVSSRQKAFIEELEKMANAQRLPLSGIVCEAEAGQFELNLRHSHQVVEVCENVLALRRLTSTLAEKFGYQANFMAKPFSQLAGNGLHFHISLNDEHGENVFASDADELNEMTRLCLAGMLHLMPASVAIMAPGVNAFRRLRKNLNEPLFNSWGYNKRSAALRIPCSSEHNRRIEYRLAGADANPYLVMATILTGMLYGLEKIDSGSLTDSSQTSPTLPLFQQNAVDEFQHCAYLTANLGEEFSQLWSHCKLAELAWFESIVTPEESAVHG